MNVYQMIKERRMELNLTQDDLAKKLGYKSRSSINKIELGKNDITIIILEKIAKALDCSPAYLMGLDDAPNVATEPDRLLDAEALTVSEDEKSLVSDYRKLNTIGKDKAREYVSDLSENEKYTENLSGKLSEKAIG